MGPRRHEFDRVLVVTAPEELRVQRLVEQRGMTEAQARARIAAQASEGDRLRIATDVIDNAGSVEDALARVDAFWASL